MRVIAIIVMSAATWVGLHRAPVVIAPPRVELLSLPAGGIQPQAATDASGVVHVVFFMGPAAGGNLFYMRRQSDTDGFSTPIRVNSVAGSALATGSVRGGQLAVGANGRVHVAWYGADTLGTSKRRPIWYARLANDPTRFEEQVNVATGARDIDGVTVAADRGGHVYVAWHGQGPEQGEAYRTVYVARSSDEGQHFAPEEPAPQASTGACGCCGLRAAIDSSGTAHLLYRAATAGVNRDATWITLSGNASRPVVLQPWKLNACPMSTFALAPLGDGMVAAWETEQQIYYARLDPRTRTFSTPIAMEGSAGRKHPSVATNAAGVTLVAWTEGTGWARGGTLAWESLDPDGRRLAAQTNATPVPVWGLVAAVARPDGSFVVLH
jgi:hypothetical protein